MEPFDITSYILKEAEIEYNKSFKVAIEKTNSIDLFELLDGGYVIMGDIDIKLKLTDDNEISDIYIADDSNGFYMYDKEDIEVDCYYDKDKIIWYFKYLLFDELLKSYRLAK